MGKRPGYGAPPPPSTVPAADYYRVRADATAFAARNAELVALVSVKDATIEAQRSTIGTQRAALDRTQQAMWSLQRVASVSVVEQYLTAAIANLTCREIVAGQDGVIRLDDGTAAYARGQSAGIGERIRALGGGCSIHRDNPAELREPVDRTPSLNALLAATRTVGPARAPQPTSAHTPAPSAVLEPGRDAGHDTGL